MKRSHALHAVLIAVLAFGLTVDILDETPAQCIEPQGSIWETISSPQLDNPAFAVDPASLAAVQAERAPASEPTPLLARKAKGRRAALPSE